LGNKHDLRFEITIQKTVKRIGGGIDFQSRGVNPLYSRNYNSVEGINA